jgi:hypothetical protein
MGIYWVRGFLVNMFPFPGPSSVGFIDFVIEGWRRVNGKAPSTETVLKARELEIRPVLRNNTEVRLVLQRGIYYYYHHPCYHLYAGYLELHTCNKPCF